MKDFRIIIREDGLDVPDHLKRDGKIILDSDEQSTYEDVAVNIALDDSNKNKIDASFSIDLPDWIVTGKPFINC